RDEFPVIAGCTQAGQISFGKALVAAHEVRRERDVLDLATTVPRNNGTGNIVEGARLARAGVKDAGTVRVVEEPEIQRDDVVDVDEIAPLLSWAVAVTALEQAHPASFAYLMEKVVRNAGHPAFVLLIRPVHVEVAQPHDLCRQLAQVATQILIEQIFRVAVNVQRRFVTWLLDVVRAGTVDGRR